MAEEKEAAFPVNAFGTLNRNADRENINQNDFYQSANLWERRLGTLETRNGSMDVCGLPHGTNSFANNFKIYKASGDNKRIVAVNNLIPNGSFTVGSLPAMISLSFINDSNGYWNIQFTPGPVTFNYITEYVIIRLVGYGQDQIYAMPTSGIAGYATAHQKLRVQVTSALPAGITGIEVLARVPIGSTRTPGVVNGSSAYQVRSLWVGYIDMTSQTTSTTDFFYCPYGTDPSYTFPQSFGNTNNATCMTFALSASNDNTGGFIAGKTYYVAVLPQYANFATGFASRCAYAAKQVNPNGTAAGATLGLNITPITIPTGSASTGKIVVSNFGLAPPNSLVAIGEHPQLLQPVALVNTAAVSSVTLTTFPAGNPAIVGIDNQKATGSATMSDLTFVFSNYSKRDMFMRINDNNSTVPIFAGRMDPIIGLEWDDGTDEFGFTGTTATSSQGYLNQLINGGIFTMPALGGGNNLIVQMYRFAQWQNLALVVCAPLGVGSVTQNIGGIASNYYVTDGFSMAPVIMDFQTTTALQYKTLPNVAFVAIWQGSVIVGGGSPGLDPVTGLALSSARTFYISQTNSFTNFTIAGASVPVLNSITLDQSNAENIGGFGFYTNTSTQLGPLNKFSILSKNGVWLIDDLPTFDTSGNITNLSSINLRLLSRKVGAVTQETVAYTPIGTVFTGYEGVFILRDDGEPTPIGQSLRDIFLGADFSAASACYHDKHYKISFYHPDYDPGGGHPSGVPTTNNCEFWLNINKVTQQKGGEAWVGPMTGRAVQFSFVEEKDGDQLTNGIPRNRYVLAPQTVYLADVEPAATATVINDVINSVTTPVTTILEGKDLQVTPQDSGWNKLFKRWYWKVRTNATSGSPLQLTDSTWVDGGLADTQTITTFAANTLNFRDQPFNFVRVFPLTRIRGRVIRKQITTSTRVAYDGYQVNYEVERRRPG